jgi:hypothetical protein
MGRRLDDRIIGARELHRYARLEPDQDVINWVAGLDMRSRFLPTRPSRSINRRHAAMRPQLWAGSQNDRAAERRMEHRVGKRYRAFRLIRLRHEDTHDTAALLYNISRNGMFALTRHPDVGPNLCVDVDLPVREGPPIRLSTLVVHRSEHGLGLIFRHLDPVAAAAVEELCTTHR